MQPIPPFVKPDIGQVGLVYANGPGGLQALNQSAKGLSGLPCTWQR
ncbi:MAG: hypothetical protein ACOVMP_02420 [Chthoniobacterales bacterium]